MAGVAGRSGIELFFQPNSITVPAGEATFLLKNGTEAPHNFVLGPDRPVCSQEACTYGSVIAASPTVQAGDADLPFTIEDLAAGMYSFWCSIDDHAVLGMVGTLTVEP